MIDLITKLNLETWILIAGMAFFLVIIYQWHTDEKTAFDVKTILLDDAGKFSLSKFGQLVCMITSTWVMIYQTRNSLLTEWLYSGYMLAWAGAGLAGKWIDKAKEPPADK